MPRRMAASRTVRAIGPEVSWLCAIGMMPARLMRPSVGLIPTNPDADDGQTTDPSVSVPMPTAARFAAIADPVPQLDPHAFRSSTYGFFVSQPRPDQPLVECVVRKFDQLLSLVIPNITTSSLRIHTLINASTALWGLT